MHIAFAITRGDAVGGATVHVRDMSRYMLDRGDRVTVLVGAARNNGNREALDEFRRYDIPCCPIPNLRRSIDPVHDLLAVRQMLSVLRRIQPDLVSTHTAKAGLIGRLAARAAGIPCLFTPHGWAIADRISSTSGRIFRVAERLAAPMARNIVNVCEAERNLALRHRIASLEKLAVIHNGVRDLPDGHRANPSLEPPKLISVARLETPKDHDLLLHALAPLRDFLWELELVGGGPREAAVRALASELRLDNRIVFTGHTSDTVGKLAGSQIFVLASKSEGFPRSILEAMRAGLPVVASDVGGVSEAVAHRETGLVVPRSDVTSLSKALASLILSPTTRTAFGRAGRLRYERNFTFDRMARQTVALYDEILNHKPVGDKIPAGTIDRGRS